MANSKVSKQTFLSGTMDDVKEVFNKFDKNGDGKISGSELKDVLRALGSNTSSEEVKRIMAELDKDANGYIDLEEFAEIYSSQPDDGDCSNKELRDAFDLYDLDKNGVISVNELRIVLNRLGEKCSLSDCRKMISSVDVDGDGNVNFEEFKKMMSRA